MSRFYEMIPGLLSWGTIAAVVFASWRLPVAAAIFIILFDIYWLLKTIYFSLHLRATFRRMRRNMKTDWLKKLEHMANGQWQMAHSDEQALSHTPYAVSSKLSAIRHWHDIYHLIILPMAGEPYEIVRESFQALAALHFPKDRMIVVLAREARIPESGSVAERIAAEFGGVFFRFLATVHPDGLPGEIPGKGSNETWAARQAQHDIIDPLGIPYERILVSVFDADTQVPPEYFGILTHAFLTAPHPQRSSYQPVALFTNNIYQAPALARVISFSSSFWHMIQQSRPERLITFSSHSMPFAALTEVGFWHTDIVSEDSQIFWQLLLHYDGDWRTVPLDYPVSMDANVAPRFWTTLANIYKQQRRWGWGCENIPYLLRGFRKNKNMPFATKIYWLFHELEGKHSWATNTIIIFSLGWLPIVLGDAQFQFSVLSYNLPRMTRWIMSFSMIGVASSAVLAMILLPPRPAWFRGRHSILYIIQWVLMPVHLIAFSSLPALEAQTRLMLGGRWRLGFWVTPKFRAPLPMLPRARQHGTSGTSTAGTGSIHSTARNIGSDTP